jgi:hypothetical protein
MSDAAPEYIRPPAGSPEESQRRHFPRNAAVLIVYDVIWTLGCGFILLAPTVPAYLTEMGASGTVMQIVTLAFPLLTGLELWSGAVCRGGNRLRRQFLIWTAFSACWMAYGLTALAGWGRWPAGVFVPLFVVACLGLGVFRHLGEPAFGELVLDCTPRTWRGRFFGLRCVLASAAGLGGAWLAATLKKRWTGMDQFHYAMIVGSAFMIVSCLCLWFLRGTERPPSPSGAPGRPAVLPAVLGLLRSRRFQRFLLFYGILISAHSLAPLIVRYGMKSLTMRQEGFTGASFIGGGTAALLVAPLADRYGFRLLGIIAGLLSAAAMGTMLVGPAGAEQALAAYALWGGSNALGVVVLANLGAELAPEASPANVIGVGMVLAMPLSLAVAPLGGKLVDAYGPSGYAAAFAGGVALSLIAAAGFRLAVREPRTRHWSDVEIHEA